MVLSKSGFNRNISPKIENFPIHFLNNVLKIIEDLNDKYDEPDFKDLVMDMLEKELIKESLDIPKKHKNRLFEVICKYCTVNK